MGQWMAFAADRERLERRAVWGGDAVSSDLHVHISLQGRMKAVANIGRQANLRAVGEERTIDDTFHVIIEEDLDGSSGGQFSDRRTLFPWRHGKIESIRHGE